MAIENDKAPERRPRRPWATPEVTEHDDRAIQSGTPDGTEPDTASAKS